MAWSPKARTCRSTPACRTSRGCMTTGWAARTTSRPTGRRPSRSSRPSRTSWSASGRSGRSSAGRCTTWWPRRASGSSWTSAPACPRRNNTHEVAQRVAPETRVVYVDNDPIVLLHARALLASSPRGRDRLHRRRPARHRDDPGRGGRHPGLQPAGRGDAARDAALRPRQRRPGRDRGPADRRRAVGQLPGHRAPGQRRRRRPGGRLDAAIQRAGGRPAHRAQPRRGLGRSSPAWTWSSPAWCSCTGGGPGPATSGTGRELANYGGVGRKP